MHVVITAECIGCELCVPPCPMDCIDLIPVSNIQYDKLRARERHRAKLARGDFKQVPTTANGTKEKPLEKASKADKQKFIQAAIARVKAARSLERGL